MSETTESGVSDAALVSMATTIMNGETAKAPSPVKTASDAMVEGHSAPVEDDEEEIAAAPVVFEADPAAIIAKKMERARAAKQAKQAERRAAEQTVRLREYEDMQRQVAQQKPAFDLEGFKRQLRNNPLTALQELGVDLGEFTSAALEEGTPQAKMMAQMRAMQDKLESFEKQREEHERDQQESRKQDAHRAHEAEFCAIITMEEYPSLHEFFSDDVPALLREARHVAQEFLSKGGDPDTVTDEDIAWYLEQKYARKVSKFKGKSSARLGTQPAPSTSRPRSPSQSKASETKLGGREFNTLSEDDQMAMLLEVARQEMSKSAN